MPWSKFAAIHPLTFGKNTVTFTENQLPMKWNKLKETLWLILEGMGSIFDFTGRNHRDLEQYLGRDDAEEIKKDWINVGNDIRAAMKEFDALKEK